MTDADALHPDTIAVHAGRPTREPDAPLSTPVHLASTYVGGGEVAYGRYGNPSWVAFEEALGALEGGGCIAFASGIAAISAVFDLVPTGGVVVAPRHSYTGTIGQLDDLARQRGVEIRYVDVADTAQIAGAAAGRSTDAATGLSTSAAAGPSSDAAAGTAARRPADLVWVESPTNPALEVGDLPAIARAARDAGALFAVDNTFASPLRQRPLADGADLVVHSATKWISGHSDVLMGAVVTRDDELRARIDGRRRLHGAIPAPLEAFLALRGLRTLAVRLDRAEASARRLVDELRDHPAVEEVRYPGFGGIVSIVVQGGAEGADAIVDRVRVWTHATSLGGVESTLERRRRWPAEAETIPAGLVRLSVGLEHPDDLVRDLVAALG